MNALKVQNQINPKTSNTILQDISTQIPSLTEAARGFRRNVPNVESGGTSTSTTKLDESPMGGSYTDSDDLFIGSYKSNKWKNSSMISHHM